MINTIVTGVCGRMGKRISELIIDHSEFDLVGVTEAPNHPEFGEKAFGLEIQSDWENIINKCDVIIDFTAPGASLVHAKLAHDHSKNIVIGTTGFSKEQVDQIKRLSDDIAIVLAPNMSVGVNLLFQLVGQVAEILSSGYDIEIVETHHRFKKDAPSGTAKKLAEIMAQAKALGEDEFVFGREGHVGERTDDEIGIHAVRGGDVVGEHIVSFLGMGERIELIHKAHSRDTFAYGALKAARFLSDKSNGLFDMQDILSLNR